jgi:hypothetical protein
MCVALGGCVYKNVFIKKLEQKQSAYPTFQMSLLKCRPKSSPTKDRCYDFLNIFAKKFSKKWRFGLKTKLNFEKI